MAAFFETLSPALIEFIDRQSIFFVATAPPESVASGRINLSPKGVDSFRVLAPDRVAFMNLTGSGNETAAHLLHDPLRRITVMFCSFDEKPLILRLYGTGETVHPSDAAWEELSSRFPQSVGDRQIIDIKISSGQTSCGFGVPLFEAATERPTLAEWASRKGVEGIRDYQRQKNARSIDGLDTGLKQRADHRG